MLASNLRLGVLASGCPGGRTNRPDIPGDIRGRTRYRRSDSRSCPSRERCRAVARTLRRGDRTPLLRFSVPFNACRPRCAARGGQASGRSRFDVSSPVCDPRVREPSPTGGVLAVFRFSDAMRLCSMCGRCIACLARRRRRVKAAATRGAARSTTVCDRSCGRCSGEPMLRATNDPSHQAPPLHGDVWSL
jgi:hypothetical protein